MNGGNIIDVITTYNACASTDLKYSFVCRLLICKGGMERGLWRNSQPNAFPVIQPGSWSARVGYKWGLGAYR